MILRLLLGISRAWHALRDSSGDCVSARWLADTERTSWTEGLDAPCWNFPINKVKNEHALFNTQRERKRA